MIPKRRIAEVEVIDPFMLVDKRVNMILAVV
jgi:hypothetical protein